MNIFKTTLIGVMVMGLTSVNVAAMGSQNHEESDRSSGIASNIIKSGLAATGASITLPACLVSCVATLEAAQAVRLCRIINFPFGLRYALFNPCADAQATVVAGTIFTALLGILTVGLGCNAINYLLKAVNQIEEAIIE